MLRLNRPLNWLILLTLTFTLLITGCTPKEPIENTLGEIEEDSTENQQPIEPPKTVEEPKVIDNSNRVEVLAPVDIPYIVANPIEIEYQETSDNNLNIFDRSIMIRGLKNKEVEDKITNRLEDIYKDIKSMVIPPYRGIKTKLSDNAEIIHDSFDAHITYSYNNVMSVLVYTNRSFAIDNTKWNSYDNTLYTGRIEGFTFDLNTGEEIKLKDIFADNVDYVSFLNDYISKEIMRSNGYDDSIYSEFGGGFKMTAPFRGISENQNFYLNYSGVTLVFDYRNPEFDNGFFPTSFYIGYYSMKDILAVTNRYFDEDIFLYETNNRPSKEFLPAGPRDFHYERNTEALGNVQLYTSISYPTESPQLVIDIVSEMTSYSQGKLDGLDEGEDITYINQYIYVEKVDKFTIITNNLNVHDNNNYDEEVIILCYDENLQPVKLKDLFVEGFDYEAMIKDSINLRLKDYGIKDEIPEGLYDNLQFRMEHSAISFVTKPFKFHQHGVQPMYFTISFSEIGTDNLTIFD